MRKYCKPIGCLVIAASAALCGAPAAAADDAEFIAGAHALGFTQPDATLVRMALSGCRFLQPNLRRNPSEVVDHIRRYANSDPASIPGLGRKPEPPLDARAFLALAVSKYCPELTNRVPPA